MKRFFTSLLAAAALAAASNLRAAPLGNAITYQGHLADGGRPATNLYDFRFTIHTDPAASAPVSASPVVKNDVPVTNGLFTVELDFGPDASVFTNQARWLEIEVRPGASASTDPYTRLEPRQPITPAPTAVYAKGAGHADSASSVPWTSISGRPSGLDDGDNDTTYAAGSGLTLSPGNIFSLGTVPLDRINTSGASAGQALTFNGRTTEWSLPSLTLSLPYAGYGWDAGASFWVRNDYSDFPDFSSSAISGVHAYRGMGVFGSSASGIGVKGSHTDATGTSPGVQGLTASTAPNAAGVEGRVSSSSPGSSSAGVRGINSGTGTSGIGVMGTHAGGGWGVYGAAPSGTGVFGQSQTGTGVDGAGAVQGVHGYSLGGYGVAGSTAEGTGVYGDNGNSDTMGHAGYFNGRVRVTQTLTARVLTITGGSDLAEPFEMSTPAVPKGAVVVIDEDHPGRLKLSELAYDSRVAGIVSGANGVNPGLTLSQQDVLGGGQHVALSGRVYVQADAAEAPIRPGDLLTTSAVPGHAMKVTDPARAQGAIIGKAMSALPEGRGHVLVLVSLQ